MMGFADLHNLPMDERVEVIANMAVTKMHNGEYPSIGFVVDNSAKADEYIAALKEIQPGIRVLARCPGPTQHAYTVKIQYDGGKLH